MTKAELVDTIEKLLEIKELQSQLIDTLQSELIVADDRVEALQDRIREMELPHQWAVAVRYADGRTAGITAGPEEAVETGLKTWRAATIGTRQDIVEIAVTNQWKEVVFYYES